LAISLILNATKSISTRQLARDLEVNKNTAWRIATQIREAMAETEQRTLLQGIVASDETQAGGKLCKEGDNGKGPNKTRRRTKIARVAGMLECGATREHSQSC